MNSLKKALAGISMLAIIFVSFSCSNASSPSDGGNSGVGVGQVVDGLGFDLSNAKSFFAGKASSATASRAIDDNSVILMKITDDGTIAPAMDFKGDNIYFNLNKILKNPATKELFLLGNFSKSSYDENGKNTGWEYQLIRVAQNGNWYGLPNVQNIQTTQEPFDGDGNFYFQRTDYSSSTSQSNIYKYSGGTATKIADKANLQRVLPNGAIIYSTENSGLNYKSYYYIRLRDGKVRQLDDYSTSVYVKDKNIFYYSIKYIRSGENNYYVDDAGNKYNSYEGSYSDYTYYANKGGKKIYVTKDGDSWKDESGKSYDSHVFYGWENFYWNYDDVGNKIYLTWVPEYYEDKDGNRYDSYEKYESGSGYYYVLKDGKKIEVEQFLDDSSDWRWKDSEGNTYDTYDGYESGKYYVFKDGKRIELERFYSYYKDSDGNNYNNCDSSESKEVHWVYQGGEYVKVECNSNNTNYYQDADGNEYFYNEVYSVDDTYYYVTINGQKVPVKPAQTYSTNVIVAKYYDFIANTTAEAVAEANFSGDVYNYNFDTSSENVFGTTFITNDLWKFEIQDDFSLKCKYNLSEKGYTVATAWNNYYNYVGENSNRYLEKFLYNGDKIYFLGTKGDRWSSDSSYNLYKIIRFGAPTPVLSDASNYAFNGNITFDDDGNFIGSVLRTSDGKWGTLSGSMEYGNYEFKEDSIFESVKDIVINFD
ncbi:MAG: hypothetical protein K2N58_09295 [Treponemataceae bacterium]|nr:hypothetical protein [Treponemataceae bacterium]